MKFMQTLWLGLGLGLMTFGSCRKADQDWSYGTDNALGEVMFGDVFGQINKTSESDGNLRNGCTTITFSAPLGQFPNTVTIDFGQGCLGSDNRLRKGKLIATYTGRWRQSGTVITVVPDGYYVNNNKVEGTLTITNLGLTGAGNMHFSYVVTNGKVTDTTGKIIEWNRNTVHEWVAGSTTSYDTHGEAGVLDDVWHITGTGSGVTRNGNAYTAEITRKVVLVLNCQWFYTDGRIDVLPAGANTTRYIDFGTGTCDNKVTVGAGNYSTEIVLQ